ncbi:hypothetical protein P7C70_g4322, partial [Phenoliferia sp. Uapishka_3]
MSDHPGIIGTGAPAITDIQKMPLGSDLTSYGSARDSFARAMQDRAMKMLDHHGALRRPSGQCTAALILMEYLATWGDVYRNEGRHLMTAAAEHLRSRNEGLSDDPTEDYSAETRISGGTIFWVLYTRDALSSAFGGRVPALTTEDLPVLCEIVASPITADVAAYVRSDDVRTLGGLTTVAIFRHITEVIRTFCARISGPLPRRQRLNLNAILEMWETIDQCRRYSEIWEESMSHTDALPLAASWIRDLVVMRSQLTHAIHINLLDRLMLETGRAATSRDPTFPAYLLELERLRDISNQRFLDCCRSIARVVVKAGGMNLLFVSAMGAENLPLYLAHMVSMPVREQQDAGSDTWTADEKREEIGWMIDGVKVIGWSWPDFQRSYSVAVQCLRDLDADMNQLRASQLAAQQRQQSRTSFESQQHPAYPPLTQPPWYPDSVYAHQQPASHPHSVTSASYRSFDYAQQPQPQPLQPPPFRARHSDTPPAIAANAFLPYEPPNPYQNIVIDERLGDSHLYGQQPELATPLPYSYAWNGSNGDGAR